jgi:uncharacterized protein
MRLICTSALIAFSLAACSPDSQSAAASAASPAETRGDVHPESGLPVVDLAIHGSGSPLRFRVEVATSSAQQAKGLMFRTAMGADEGMIFPMNPPRMASFWMRNTVIPLDLLFVGPDQRVINIAANAVPYSEAPLQSDAPVSAVLELNGGRAAQLGIKPGDKVVWQASKPLGIGQ